MKSIKDLISIFEAEQQAGNPAQAVTRLQSWLTRQGFDQGIDGAPLETNGKFTANTYNAMLDFINSNPKGPAMEEFKKLAMATANAPIDAAQAELMKSLDTGSVPQAAVPTPTSATMQSAGKRQLAPQDPGTSTLQQWLNEQGFNKGFDNKPLQVDGRFGPNTYFASRKFIASKPAPELKTEFEELLNNVQYTMHINADTISQIDNAVPMTALSQQELGAEYSRQRALGQTAKTAEPAAPEQQAARPDSKQQALDAEYQRQKALGQTATSTATQPATKAFSGRVPGFNESLERIVKLSRI